MSFDKEFEVEATIKITTSFLCDTKREAEKEAYKYVSELWKLLYPIVITTATKARTIIAVQRIEPYKEESRNKE